MHYIFGNKRAVAKVGTQGQLDCIQCSEKWVQTNISGFQFVLLQDDSKTDVTIKC